jgi:hypothetical protein
MIATACNGHQDSCYPSLTGNPKEQPSSTPGFWASCILALARPKGTLGKMVKKASLSLVSFHVGSPICDHFYCASLPGLLGELWEGILESA